MKPNLPFIIFFLLLVLQGCQPASESVTAPEASPQDSGQSSQPQDSSAPENVVYTPPPASALDFSQLRIRGVVRDSLSRLFISYLPDSGRSSSAGSSDVLRAQRLEYPLVAQTSQSCGAFELSRYKVDLELASGKTYKLQLPAADPSMVSVSVTGGSFLWAPTLSITSTTSVDFLATHRQVSLNFSACLTAEGSGFLAATPTVRISGDHQRLNFFDPSAPNVALTPGDLLLVTHQSAPERNGVYKYVASGLFVRYLVGDAVNPLSSGLELKISRNGTTVDEALYLAWSSGQSVGVSPQYFFPFVPSSGVNSITAGLTQKWEPGESVKLTVSGNLPAASIDSGVTLTCPSQTKTLSSVTFDSWTSTTTELTLAISATTSVSEDCTLRFNHSGVGVSNQNLDATITFDSGCGSSEECNSSSALPGTSASATTVTVARVTPSSSLSSATDEFRVRFSQAVIGGRFKSNYTFVCGSTNHPVDSVTYSVNGTDGTADAIVKLSLPVSQPGSCELRLNDRLKPRLGSTGPERVVAYTYNPPSISIGYLVDDKIPSGYQIDLVFGQAITDPSTDANFSVSCSGTPVEILDIEHLPDATNEIGLMFRNRLPVNASCVVTIINPALIKTGTTTNLGGMLSANHTITKSVGPQRSYTCDASDVAFGGAGTKGDPFVLCSCEHLRTMYQRATSKQDVDDGNYSYTEYDLATPPATFSGRFVLATSIDLFTCQITPVGGSYTDTLQAPLGYPYSSTSYQESPISFTGVLDGNGHAVTAGAMGYTYLHNNPSGQTTPFSGSAFFAQLGTTSMVKNLSLTYVNQHGDLDNRGMTRAISSSGGGYFVNLSGTQTDTSPNTSFFSGCRRASGILLTLTQNGSDLSRFSGGAYGVGCSDVRKSTINGSVSGLFQAEGGLRKVMDSTVDIQVGSTGNGEAACFSLNTGTGMLIQNSDIKCVVNANSGSASGISPQASLSVLNSTLDLSSNSDRPFSGSNYGITGGSLVLKDVTLKLSTSASSGTIYGLAPSVSAEDVFFDDLSVSVPSSSYSDVIILGPGSYKDLTFRRPVIGSGWNVSLGGTSFENVAFQSSIELNCEGICGLIEGYGSGSSLNLKNFQAPQLVMNIRGYNSGYGVGALIGESSTTSHVVEDTNISGTVNILEGATPSIGNHFGTLSDPGASYSFTNSSISLGATKNVGNGPNLPSGSDTAYDCSVRFASESEPGAWILDFGEICSFSKISGEAIRGSWDGSAWVLDQSGTHFLHNAGYGYLCTFNISQQQWESCTIP